MVRSAGVVARLLGAMVLAALTASALPAVGVAGGGGDSVGSSIAVGSLPFSTTGTTAGTSLGEDEPWPWCRLEVLEHSRWFTLTPAFTGTVRVTASSSAINPIISTFKGATYAAMQEIDCNDDIAAIAGKTDARLAFDVVAGQPIHILVASATGGAFSLDVRKVTRVPNDEPATPTALAQAPTLVAASTINATLTSVEPTIPGCIEMAATRWYRIKPSSAAALQAWVTDARFHAFVVVLRKTTGGLVPLACNSRVYRGSSITWQGRATWKAAAGVTYLIGVGGYFGESGPFRLNVAKVTRPGNDDQGKAAAITSIPATLDRSTVNATHQLIGDVLCPDSLGPTADVWYRWTPSDDDMNRPMRASASLPSLNGSALLVVYEDVGSGLVPVGCGDGVDFTTEAGVTYWFRVFGPWGSTSDKVRLRLRDSGSP